jgi:MFS transporter, UMF1 family
MQASAPDVTVHAPAALPSRRAAVAWAFYDWANSAFSVTVISAFFPILLKQYWSTGADATTSTFQLGVANAAGSVVIALLSPLLGAMADRGGRRKRYLLLFACMGIVMTGALQFVARGEWALAILLYSLAQIGFSGSIQFYDALLVNVAREPDYHRVSALGFALGYLGGGLLFTLDVAMMLQPQAFGLADATQAARVAFGTVAVWWALFTVPLLLFVREPRQRAAASLLAAVADSLRELASTLHAIRKLRPLVIFLAAYWLYIDGVGTIARMALDYGMALGFDQTSLILALLITQFVGFPAAIAFGALGTRIGAKPGIGIGIAVYVGVTVYCYFMRSTYEFYVLACIVGLVQGGVQSLSRSLFAQMVPLRRAGEFFGFYNMLGKFAAVLGPLLIGVVAITTGSSRLAVLAVVVLFVAGGVLLTRVDEQEGRRVAAERNALR